VEYEVFPEPEVVEVKKKGDGEDEEEVQEQPPAEEEEGEKKPKFRVEDWKWTITDRKPKNLPQLFMQIKGIRSNDMRSGLLNRQFIII